MHKDFWHVDFYATCLIMVLGFFLMSQGIIKDLPRIGILGTGMVTVSAIKGWLLCLYP